MIFERIKEALKEEILEVIHQNYEIPKEIFKNYIFLMSGKRKVWIMRKRNMSTLVINKAEILLKKANRLGFQLGEIDKRGFRFTIEGTQLFGRYAKKNVYEMNEKEVELWIRGLDLDIKEINMKGFVIMKHSEDFYGSGLVQKGKIKNLIPKIRRIKKYKDMV